MIYLTNNVGQLSAEALPVGPLRRHSTIRHALKDVARAGGNVLEADANVLEIEPTFNSIKVAGSRGETREIQLREDNRLLNDLKSGYGVEFSVPLEEAGDREVTVRWEAKCLSSIAPDVISKAARDISPPGLPVDSDLKERIQKIPQLRMPFLLVSQHVIYPEGEAEVEATPSGKRGFTNWYLEEI